MQDVPTLFVIPHRRARHPRPLGQILLRPIQQPARGATLLRSEAKHQETPFSGTTSAILVEMHPSATQIKEAARQSHSEV